jgi:hypothetical protein
MVMMISTYNPNTPGDLERAQKEARENPVMGGSRVMTNEELAALNSKASSGYGGVLGKIQDVIEPVAKPIVENIPKVDTNTLIAVAAAYYLPGLGASLGAELFATQIATGAMTAAQASAIGTAIVSTASQTAQGVDFDTALQNATVNAVVSTQSPTIANDIAKTVGQPGVADAITSAGSSIVSTMAKGGSAEDALKNAGAAIIASGVSGVTDRATGAAVGGAITGGATGAALGAVGELGRPPATSGDRKVASAGDVNQEPGVVSDVSFPNVDIADLRPRDTTIADTNTQIIDTIRNQQPTTPPATRTEAPVEITAPRIPEIEITAPREPAKIEDTDIQNVDVVDKREEEEPLISKEKTKKTGLYEPNLFIYSGKAPKARGGGTLSQSLGIDFAGGTPTATTGLTSYRAAGEIEGEGGTNRKNVWNEESLRLKDALGL